MTQGPGVRRVDFVGLRGWFDRVREPGSPVREAERHFETVVWSKDDDVPGLAAYDDLFAAALLGHRWVVRNPCPDEAVGRLFLGQMTAYRDIADTVRSAVDIHGDAAAMVSRLAGLRTVVDDQAEAIDRLEP